jgi:magnesium transporter
MRKISAWAAILAVPTLIAGIYGMNFRNMPELHWRLGYPEAVTGMLLICVGLWAFFRHIDWL